MLIWSRNGYNIFRSETYRCACYIIESKGIHVLVDTSMKFERTFLTESIRKSGAKKIDAIFLTHSHTDHVANAKYFSNTYHCNVYVSEKGLHKVQSGYCDIPKGASKYGRLIHWIASKLPFVKFKHYEACSKAEVLNSKIVKSYLGEATKMLETPGHSNDSISILIDGSIAIVGDAMVNMFGNQYPPFADKEEAVKTSWKALLDTQCKLFCPSHGKPIKRTELIAAYKKA